MWLKEMSRLQRIGMHFNFVYILDISAARFALTFWSKKVKQLMNKKAFQ